MGSKHLHSGVSYKRAQKGCFRWPEASPGEIKVTLTPEEFAMLIWGMDP